MRMTTVDTSDWSDWDRTGVSAPYAVDGAPYGDSLVTAWFETEDEAREYARASVESTEGTTYATSWGEQAANSESFRITHYVHTDGDTARAERDVPASDGQLGTQTLKVALSSYSDAPVPARSAARSSVPGIVTSMPTHAATVLAFGRPALAGPGLSGHFARYSRKGA